MAFLPPSRYPSFLYHLESPLQKQLRALSWILNYVLDDIQTLFKIYIPTLPSSLPLLMPRISTEFTGNRMKAIKSLLGLAFQSACPVDERPETQGSHCLLSLVAMRPWPSDLQSGCLALSICRDVKRPPPKTLSKLRACTSPEIGRSEEI